MSFRVAPSLSSLCQTRNEMTKLLRTQRRQEILLNQRNNINILHESIQGLLLKIQKGIDVDENLKKLRTIIMKSKRNWNNEFIDNNGTQIVLIILQNKQSSNQALEIILWILTAISSFENFDSQIIFSYNIFSIINPFITRFDNELRLTALWLLANLLGLAPSLSVVQVQDLLSSLCSCIQLYHQYPSTVDSCAACFKRIIEHSIYPYEYFHQILTLFLNTRPLSNTFVDCLSLLITQKPYCKPLLSKSQLLPTITYFLFTKNNFLFHSILNFFTELSMLNENLGKTCISKEAVNKMVVLLKELLNGPQHNENDISQLLIIFGNLTMYYLDFNTELVEIIQTIIAKSHYFTIKELQSLIFFLNNLVLHANEQFKLTLCCLPIFELYGIFLLQLFCSNDFLIQTLTRIKELLIVCMFKGFDVLKLLNESALEVGICKLEYHFCKQVSQMAVSIEELFIQTTTQHDWMDLD
ncbi:hypothetical protein EHI8A_072240 [Entamoeba histolytica HM-1:IMSS-B]|uniref:Importin alpha n=6 Tax=Entamoeba histolytica TaxID=5759 RepID=C4LXU0_ENTH1|nr:hypothetical protein EHI_087580 [Entamoeba histolytica HM-1:IMSS]EMD42758.1 Hypothetical protein EHI5A_106720 [Entamoeba histolytica KU27]EMH73866.1 hypothetical protein EHI8A_072240 [Entamoeba histolytica HM-1:IMSS-B]EMS14818.1 hypothetical protein KM1_130450 [Entamoeba histolytica HM-3:IMSS]ENY65112.1 hypothetical protein EHI7A_070550 [Entamoeba histolytica HM-1:IMSS-A]GAT93591.1 hypothetical protein CL6EHI_087580 [Entamoeba histolytica]|eukprot:XP_651356.1 hypothetical protein EHI_087580 [Entamoeba histolytica HM-1:IMSS]